MHRNKSRSKLKLYYCTWGVGILFYYVKFYLLILREIDYYKQSFSKLNPLSADNSLSKLAQHSCRVPLGPLFSILKGLSDVDIVAPSSRVAR